jgi:trehalose 6-phosphate phosphatase
LEHGLETIRDTHPGTRIERKPTSLVLHTRGLPGDVASDAVQAGAALARRHTGVHVTPGKDVLELALTEAGKGPALLALAHERGAGSLMYVGDDVTDERAFRHLRDHAGDDLQVLAVKVGPGASIADVRVADEAATVDLLRELHSLLTR